MRLIVPLSTAARNGPDNVDEPCTYRLNVRPRLLQALGEEAERSNRPLAGIMQEARDCLREMAPRHSTVAVDMMAALGRYLYTRGFDPAIDYLDADLERLRALSKQYPIAFLMTHKSHLDGFLLMSMFYDLDMPPVHLFSGFDHYYATLAHELSHWTGHASRLGRDLRKRFGTAAYAAEELVALSGQSAPCLTHH